MQTSLRTVQQSLACRGVVCQRVEPYADGRCRYGVWPNKRKYLAHYTDDIEHAYIMGLNIESSLQ